MLQKTGLAGVLAFLLLFSCKSVKNYEPAAHPSLQMKAVPQGLGVNIHFYQGNDDDWSMIGAAGLGIVRMDVSWNSIEKKPGEYDFSAHDRLISQLKDRNIRLLFIIDYGNPLYDEGLAPFSEAGREAYKRFCTALVSRYAGKNIIWELWNEPNLDHFWRPRASVDDYITWCQTVVPVIRENDPTAAIVGPAISSFDIPFLEDCFQRGLLELVDGITVHPYRNPWLGPESAVEEYQVVKTLIAQYQPDDRQIPVISGEWGYSTTNLSDTMQGTYLPRQWLSNMMTGIPISIWYDWHDDGKDAENAEHNFGTVMWDYQPKPAYGAMQVLIRELNGYQPGPPLNLAGGNDYFVAFFKDNLVKFAGWTTSNPHQVVLNSEMKIASVINTLDEPQAIEPENKLMITNNPAFITIADPLPAWLNLLKSAFFADRQHAQKSIQDFLGHAAGDQLSRTILSMLNSNNTHEKKIAYQTLYLLAVKLLPSSEDALTVYHLILQDADDVLNRKQVLNRLARLCTAESLPYVMPFINDPQLGQEAANYYLALAYKLADEGNHSQSEKLLVDAARVSKHRHAVDRVIKRIKKTGGKIDNKKLSELSRRAGFVNQWWLAGPFPNDRDEAEIKAYFPEKNIDFSQNAVFDSLTASWKKIDLPGIYAIIPFEELFGKRQLAAYAFATIKMPEEIRVTLKVGSNDGIVCWINGKKVHENLTARPLVIDEDIFQTSFKKGVNRILLKVPNKGAKWEACLRICEADGLPLDLNRFQLNTE